MKAKTMTNYSRKIWNYKFADAKSKLWAIPATHFLMAASLWSIQANYLSIQSRTFFNLIVFLIFLLAIKLLNWKRLKVIYSAITFYLIVFILEVALLGIPTPLLKMTSSEVSKGFLTEVIIQMLPWVYIGLRAGMILLFIPLINVLKNNPSRSQVTNAM